MAAARPCGAQCRHGDHAIGPDDTERSRRTSTCATPAQRGRRAVAAPLDAARGGRPASPRLGRRAGDAYLGRRGRCTGRRRHGVDDRVGQPAPGLARCQGAPGAPTPGARCRDARGTWSGGGSRPWPDVVRHGRVGRARASRRFAARHGFEAKSRAINRRQVLAEAGLSMRSRAPLRRGPAGGRRLRARPTVGADSRRRARRGGRDVGRDQRRPDRRPRHRGRGVRRPNGSAPTRRPSWVAATGSTGSSPGTARPASWPATRSWWWTASGRELGTSTTPRSSAATAATGSACCSRPT